VASSPSACTTCVQASKPLTSSCISVVAVAEAVRVRGEKLMLRLCRCTVVR
jgi:hypothetical protein